MSIKKFQNLHWPSKMFTNFGDNINKEYILDNVQYSKTKIPIRAERVSQCVLKGMGILLKILHLSYSFGQKCSKLGTCTVKGLIIQKRE
jgi:hypothetical protein